MLRSALLIFFLTLASPLAGAEGLDTLNPSAPMPAPLSPQELAIMQSIAQIESDPNYINVGLMKGVRLDLRYASENNFLKRNLYGPFNRCYLHRVAAEKLKRAIELLEMRKPGYQLLIFDGLRPRSVQRQLWDAVVKTPQEKYVADPAIGSIHNFGLAVDLSVLDAGGRELDMGTAFDFFGPLSEPALEAKFLKQGRLTAQQVENRLLLRGIMTEAGFYQLASEWWHYDALPKDEVRRAYKIVE